MDHPLTTSLVVSGIGMLLLFAALAFLCGLMYLMTAFIKDRPEAEEQETEGEKQEVSSDSSPRSAAKGEKRETGKAQRAAAIAVALARAELELGSISAPGADEAGDLSAWRALHQQRQLSLNQPTRRIR